MLNSKYESYSSLSSDDDFEDYHYDEYIPEKYKKLWKLKTQKKEHFISKIYNFNTETFLFKSNVSMKKGIYLFKIVWRILHRPENCGIGVMNVKETEPILGQSKSSWCWDLTNNGIYHDGIFQKYYPGKNFIIPSVIYVIVDMEEKIVCFITRDKFMRTAFEIKDESEIFLGIDSSENFNLEEFSYIANI